MASEQNVIEIEHITKDYGNNRGVFDVSFTVHKGEVVGFIGPNGAGKTTTIRQLMGFIHPNSGHVRINGLDCFSSASIIQGQLGYLPGEIAFMDDMTGTDFIHFIAGMKKISNKNRSKELMELFELDPRGKIKKMSKGMKQKIGIVCAFMQDADILILDEPTSGLDPLMQNRFIELIQKEKEHGKTILMSSHIFEEIERTCDRAAMIKDGRLIAVDKMEKLQGKKQKTYQFTFSDEKNAASFCAELKKTSGDNTILTQQAQSVEIQGTIAPDILVKTAGRYTVADLSVKTPSLEELFMHFYGHSNDH